MIGGVKLPPAERGAESEKKGYQCKTTTSSFISFSPLKTQPGVESSDIREKKTIQATASKLIFSKYQFQWTCFYVLFAFLTADNTLFCLKLLISEPENSLNSDI